MGSKAEKEANDFMKTVDVIDVKVIAAPMGVVYTVLYKDED